MLKAFNTYDPSKGWKFATYAARCMNNEILMELRKSKKWGLLSSLDAPVFEDMGGDKEMTILDVAPDKSIDIEKQCENTELVRIILEKGKELLSEREYACILNILEDDPVTQSELAEKWGLAQSYVSRIAKKALLKLRKFLLSEEVKPTPIPVETVEKNTIKKERKKIMKTKNNAALIPGNSAQEKVNYLYLEDPEISASELSEKLGIRKSSIYTYLSVARRKFDIQKNEKDVEVSDEVKETLKSLGTNHLEKVKYLRQHFPEMHSTEMAKLIGCSKNSVRSYLSTINKELDEMKNKQEEPKVIFNEGPVKHEKIPIFAADAKNPVVIENPVEESVPKNVASPSLISMSMENAPSKSLQYMLNNLASILQDSETYDLTISVTKH